MISSHKIALAVLAGPAFILSIGAPAAAQTIPAPKNSGPAVLAQLTSKLDTKTAKVGDAITARTLDKVKLKDETEIPRGSKLIGVVTGVLSKKTGGGTSMLYLKFDQAQIKKEAPISIRGALVAVASPPIASSGPAPSSLPPASESMTGQGLPQSVATLGKYAAGTGSPSTIPYGSTLPGVGLGNHVDADGTSVLEGLHKDIKLERDARVIVAFL